VAKKTERTRVYELNSPVNRSMSVLRPVYPPSTLVAPPSPLYTSIPSFLHVTPGDPLATLPPVLAGPKVPCSRRSVGAGAGERPWGLGVGKPSWRCWCTRALARGQAGAVVGVGLGLDGGSHAAGVLGSAMPNDPACLRVCSTWMCAVQRRELLGVVRAGRCLAVSPASRLGFRVLCLVLPCRCGYHYFRRSSCW
jgi:hypothetical protein